MRFIHIKIFFAFLAPVLVCSCKKSDDVIKRKISHISFLNLLPDSIPQDRPTLRLGVDFYLGEQLINVNPFLYRQGTSRYIDLISNNTQIYIRRGNDLLVTDTLKLAENGYYTVFLGHTAKKVGLRDTIFNLVTEDVLSISPQKAKVRFAFLSPDMPVVNVVAKLLRSEKDTVLLSGAGFKGISAFQDIRPESVIFQFVSADKTTRVADTVNLQSGKIYTYTTHGNWVAFDGNNPTFNAVETINK